VFLLWPLSILLVVAATGRFGSALLRRKSRAWSRTTSARFDLLRFVLGGLVSLSLAALVAALLDLLGFDPRGGLVDTYVQRNALVVGFVMASPSCP